MPEVSLARLESRLGSSSGRDLIDILLSIAGKTAESDPGGSEEMASRALGLSRDSGYGRGEACALFALGDISRIREEYPGALRNYSAALEGARAGSDTILEARCRRRLGDVHYYTGNLEASMKHYLAALDIFERAASKHNSSRHRIQSAHLMATIGNVLRLSGDLSGSLEYYHRCREVYSAEGYTSGIPGILYNIGNILQSRGMSEEAMKAYREVLGKTGQRGGPYLPSLAHNSLGSLLLEMDDLDGAEEHFRRSLALSERTGRKRGILISTVKLVELERHRGNNRAALKRAEEAEALALSIRDRGSLADVLRAKTLIHKNLGEYEEALEASLAFRSVSEELHSEKRSRELDLLRVRYEAEARERKIEQLRKQRETQRKLIAAAVVGLAFAGVSLVSMYRNMRYRTKTNAELSRAYARVERLSRTDPLTGLANRRAMMERLSAEEARYRRTGRPYALILCDIDDFKRVNDRYGHDCGDRVLRHVTECFGEVLREHDVASRWGGEEFLLLLPETSVTGAVNAAEKARRAIAGSPVSHDNEPIRLTMTFGVSPGGGLPVDRAIQMADRALYRGKEKGKNRVCLQTPH